MKTKEYYNGIGKVIIRIGSEMKRVILLTGDKLLRKPRNLYYLMRIVRPDLMPGFYEFGYRYCDPRQSFDGIDFEHSSNLTELKKILDKRIKVRSRRSVVFDEMQRLMRTKFEVNVDV